MSRGRAIRWTLGALLAFVAAGVIAPYVSADRFGNALRNSLERSLRRKVETGKVHFNLFRGPGFTISDVVIHDDAEFGIEPLAWVDSLEVRPSLLALLTGKVEFASLRLNDPWVNLTKAPGEAGRWNFTQLLDPAALPSTPEILVRNGRINFKFGDTKAVFYFSNADIDVDAEPGRWALRVRAEAARTDRPARSMGYFEGRGAFGGGKLDFDLELERSPVGAMIALFHGSDVGVRGFAVGRVKLAGPLEAIRINGIVRFEDLHRWDQKPSNQTWPMPVEGLLDLRSQRLTLASVSENKEAPVSLRYRVENYLSRPRWGINVSWSRFPVDVVLPAARQFGLEMPEGARATGTIDGVVGYSGESGVQGEVVLSNASLAMGLKPGVAIARAEWILDRDGVILRPSEIAAGTQTATVESSYRWDGTESEWVIESGEMSAAGLPWRQAGIRIPLLEAISGGAWKGKLTFRRGEGWFGQAQLTDAALGLPAGDVTLQSANVVFYGAKVSVDKIQGSAGAIGFTGSYLYQPDTERPHRFQLLAAEADARELLRVLAPLFRREESLVDRALSFGKPDVPAWIRSVMAEGTMKIGVLRAGASRLDAVEAAIEWEGSTLRLRPSRARAYTVDAMADLSPSPAKVEGSYATGGGEGVWRVVWKGAKPAVEITPDGGKARVIALE